MNYTPIQYIEILAGTDIKNAIKEAIDLAYSNRCIVKFNFNGIEMKIYYFSTVDEKHEHYLKQIKES